MHFVHQFICFSNWKPLFVVFWSQGNVKQEMKMCWLQTYGVVPSAKAREPAGTPFPPSLLLLAFPPCDPQCSAKQYTGVSPSHQVGSELAFLQKIGWASSLGELVSNICQIWLNGCQSDKGRKKIREENIYVVNSHASESSVNSMLF